MINLKKQQKSNKDLADMESRQVLPNPRPRKKNKTHTICCGMKYIDIKFHHAHLKTIQFFYLFFSYVTLYLVTHVKKDIFHVDVSKSHFH